MAEGACDVDLVVNVGRSPKEVSWRLESEDGKVMETSPSYTTIDQSDRRPFTLTDGTYNVRMFDTLGDGWDGTGSGATISADGTVIASATLEGGTEGYFAFNLDCR